MIITDKEIDYARKMIPIATEHSEKYIKKVTHWVISPCPCYFDGGDSYAPLYEVCAAGEDGEEGDYIWMGTEWECYNIYVALFGDENVRRSSLYSYIYE